MRKETWRHLILVIVSGEALLGYLLILATNAAYWLSDTTHYLHYGWPFFFPAVFGALGLLILLSILYQWAFQTLMTLLRFGVAVLSFLLIVAVVNAFRYDVFYVALSIILLLLGALVPVVLYHKCFKCIDETSNQEADKE